MDLEILLRGETLNAQELARLKKKKRIEKRKQKKLERKAKLLEKKKNLLKDYLAREIKYGQNTLRKYQKEWEKLLKTIALPRQLEEVELAQQNFERIMDTKDYIISCLMDKLQQDEDYYLMCINAHISEVDKIIARFHQQLVEFRKDYNDQIEILTKKENEFITTIENTTISRMNDLKVIIFGEGMKEKTEEMNFKAAISAQEEAELDRQDIMLYQPRIEFEGMLRFLWESKQEVFRAYKAQTKTWRSDYEDKRTANENFEKLSIKQLKKIERLSTTIKQLRNFRGEYIKLELEDTNWICNYLREAYLRLKQKLTGDLKMDKRKHKMLVWICHGTYSDLNDIFHLGKNLIRCLQCCRRLETVKEKLLPYPESSISDVVKKDNMFLFWQKMGNADASRSALMEEKIALKRENNKLRQLLMNNVCVCYRCPKLPLILKKVPITDGPVIRKKTNFRKCARR